MPRFNDKSSALIIGASGGIGLALTKQLLADHRFANVFATAREPDSNAELKSLRDQHQSLQLVSLEADKPASFTRLADHIQTQDVRLSLVVYSAGLLHENDSVAPEKRLEDIDLKAMEQVFAVNAFGPALMFQAFLPLMIKKHTSVMAAVSARVGSIEDNRLGGWYSYRASKSALNQLMCTAAIEARRRFKKCILTCVHPGTTDTALSKPFQANVPADKLFDPEFVAKRFMAIFEDLEIEDSGCFLAWDGQKIPW